METDVQPIPEGYHTVTPYLIVDDPDGLIRFLQEAFDAESLGRWADAEGRVMHAVVRIGDSPVMLGGATEEWGAKTAMLHLYVDDVDGIFRQAVAAGGRPLREPEDMFYGDRSAGVADPFGNQWWIATHVEDVSEEEMARRQAAGARG